MNDLRTEVREAFEKEQAAHPTVPSLRYEVLRAITPAEPQPTGTRRASVTWLERIAVAAAVLVIAAILLGLVASRLIARPNVPGLTPPPAGIHLFYVLDPRNAAVLDAYDWKGDLRGQVQLPQALDPNHGTIVEPAPDGSAFVFINRGRASYLDRLGAAIPGPVIPGANYSIWAADGRTQCGVGYDPAAGWQLFTQSPGAPTRAVTVLSHEDSSQGRLSPIACSFASDRALVVRSDALSQDVTELWVVRLSDGVVVRTSRYSPAFNGSFVASPSGAYLAFNSALQSDPPATTIAFVDGTPITSLPPSFRVLAFSGDERTLLVSSGSHATTVNLRSGQLIWTLPQDFSPPSFLAEPGGDAFALYTRPAACAVPCVQSPIITIVRADGSHVTLPYVGMPLW